MTKKKPKDQPSPRNAVQIVVRGPSDTTDAAIARTLTKPSVQAAATIQKLQPQHHEVNALARELAVQVEAVNEGDLTRAEAILVAQAHTLDELFNNLARRAVPNIGEYLNAAETYFRLALKAQSQCRATLETLAQIKNPPTIFAKQANVTTGPQQVNNAPAIPSRAREMDIDPNRLLEAHDGERLDTGTSGAAIGADPAMATLGEVDGAEDAGRKSTR